MSSRETNTSIMHFDQMHAGVLSDEFSGMSEKEFNRQLVETSLDATIQANPYLQFNIKDLEPDSESD